MQFKSINENSSKLSVQDVIQKYSPSQSQTNTIQQENQMLNQNAISKILSDFSISCDEPEMYIGLNHLKDQVLTMLFNYRKSLGTQQSIDSQVWQNEVSQIALEYSLYSQQGKSQNNPELQNICELVEDFVQKFSTSTKLDISIVNSFPVNDQFYELKEIEQLKLNEKLQELSLSLQNQLDKLELKNTKAILCNMIKHLNEILLENDSATIKTVISKIESKMKQISIPDQSLLELFDYICKVVKISRNKLSSQNKYEILKIYNIMKQLENEFTYRQSVNLWNEYKKMQSISLEQYIQLIKDQHKK